MLFNSSAKFEVDMTYRYRVRATTLFPQLKVPFLPFLGGKEGQISNFIFLSPKGTSLAGKTYCA